MSIKSKIYRLLTIHNDVSAAAKGPVPYAKRVVRKSAYRNLARGLRKLGL